MVDTHCVKDEYTRSNPTPQRIKAFPTLNLSQWVQPYARSQANQSRSIKRLAFLVMTAVLCALPCLTSLFLGYGARLGMMELLLPGENVVVGRTWHMFRSLDLDIFTVYTHILLNR